MDKPNTLKHEPKKPYSPPTLVLYGTVRELTRSNGPDGSRDNSGKLGRNRTAL
jgi:hypothetical protein